MPPIKGRGDRTVSEIAQSLGVAENMLQAWKRRLEPATTHDRGESFVSRRIPSTRCRSRAICFNKTSKSTMMFRYATNTLPAQSKKRGVLKNGKRTSSSLSSR
jgi:transposase-like protein